MESAGLVVVFGGTDGSGATGAMGDTWTWNGSSWHRLNPEVSPPARAFAGLASDGSGGLILFGGGAANADQVRNDTWRWDGTNWTQLHPAHPGPTLSTPRVMAYDPAIHRIVLFTGNETWEWTGSDWLHLMISGPTQAGASQRQYFGLAFDPASNRLLLFGGTLFGPPFTRLADTWAFDGHSWERLSVAGPGGGVAVMGTVRDGVIMLGEGGSWKWTGSTWLRQPTATGPQWGVFGAMAAAGGPTALLVPGKPEASGSPQLKVWVWTGSGWKPAD